MSLFVCAKCGCVDNTATSSYSEYQINGKKYAGEIWATSWEEAECFIKQRASTEKVVGFIPKD